MGHLRRNFLLAATITATAAASCLLAVPASGVAPAKCTPGIATGIAWDHSDPQYLQLITTVDWKNCGSAIRKVVLETRRLDEQGGLKDTWTHTYTADLAHSSTGTERYNAVSFLGPSGELTGNYKSQYSLMNCSKTAAGKNALMAGITFYNVATAYDKRGRKILQKISPRVACDQNG